MIGHEEDEIAYRLYRLMVPRIERSIALSAAARQIEPSAAPQSSTVVAPHRFGTPKAVALCNRLKALDREAKAKREREGGAQS